MNDVIINDKGKWLVEGNVRMLVEPSKDYIIERELEEQLRQEQELLDSLIPSDKEMLMAEVEIQTITILMEVGLI